jgi:hypothetical protein
LVSVQALTTGLATDELFTQVLNTLLNPIPGVEGVTNPGIIGNGEDLGNGSPFGMTAVSPTVQAQLKGPIGQLAGGHSLLLVDPSVLPNGVPPQDLQITASPSVVSQTAVPVIFKNLQITRDPKTQVITSTRIDPDPSTLYVPSPTATVTFWASSISGGLSAEITQSDASPAFDARSSHTSKASYFTYYKGCRSGGPLSACGQSLPGKNPPLVLGSGPTHTGDLSSAVLLAQAHGGSAGAEAAFDRVQFNLAQPATLTAQGTVGIYDLGLTTEHTASNEQTLIDVPNGNANFGGGSTTVTDDELGHPVAVQLPGDASSGLKVQGPGSAEVLVGVESFAEADADNDKIVTFKEFPSQNSSVFDSLDQPDEFGIKHGQLTAADAPFIPTGQGGALTLQSSASTGEVLGLETTGNLPTLSVPVGGASLTVVAGGNILLQDAGYIGTLQGGAVTVSSIGGAVLGGTPAAGTVTKRGIVTLFAPPPPSGDTTSVSPTGGGPISVDAFGDINVGGLALATLSASPITLDSRAGSVNGGAGKKFQNATLALNPGASEIAVEYEGSGVSADGPLNIVAKKAVVIGAGISGTTVNITAQSLQGGPGSLTGTTITISAETITGNISATAGISITGNASGATLSSSGGLVTGAGATVASNTGSGRASAENTLASNTAEERASYTGDMGSGSGGGVSGKRVVLIDVSSSPCTDQDCS